MINSALDCNSKNLVYGLFCDKANFNQIYIGKTEPKLKERLSEHNSSVRKKEKDCETHYRVEGFLFLTKFKKIFIL